MISLFEKLGLIDQIREKLKQTPTGVFVGTIIANHEVEIGFQQVGGVGNFPGVDYVGPLPGRGATDDSVLERDRGQCQGSGRSQGLG